MNGIRKIMAAVLLGMACLPMVAQTEFRSISLDEALAAAKQENKMVFIDFYTDWCGPCKKMAKEVFPQKKVGDFFNAKFVCLKLNAEKEGKELAAKYQVRAYPTYVVLDTKGEVVMDAKGSMDADSFIDKIKSGLDPEKSPKRLAERYEAGERTPDLVNNYALYMMEQGKEQEGFKIVDDYFNSLSEADRLLPENSFIYTRYTFRLEDAKAQFLIDHRKQFAKETKEQLDKRIENWCSSAVTGYFSGYRWSSNTFNQDEYQQLKKLVSKVGLDKEHHYKPVYALIESRVANDDATFLADCEKYYPELDAADRDLLIMNMSRLIKSQDAALLKRTSTFIRSHLAELSSSAIALAGRILQTIETEQK